MEKALLVGNGLTSFLISNYKNRHMMELMECQCPEILNRANEQFEPFRQLDKNIEGHHKEQVLKLGIGDADYQKYFIDYGLSAEVSESKITNIEALLKILGLKDFDKAELAYVQEVANQIYFNNGEYGINAVDAQNFNQEAFANWVNRFSEVYTTNFDMLLDDASSQSIKHLHGGFNYTSYIDDGGNLTIERRDSPSFEKCHLIWGANSVQKQQASSGGAVMGLAKIGLAKLGGCSVLLEHLDALRLSKVDELHIFGYSGQNDQHINNAVDSNPNIQYVVKYCNPEQELDNSVFKAATASLYPNKEILFRSWDDVWSLLLS